MILNCSRIAPLLAALSAAAVACLSAQTTQGIISGYIYGPNGKPLGGTTVWANIVSPVPRPVDRNSVLPSLSTSTANDGSFALSSVPAGDYVVCASNPAVAALNPCTWGGAPLIKMTSGLHAAGQSIHMAAAAAFHLHLDDPSGLLTARSGKRGASLIIGLKGPFGFLALPTIGSTATSRDYQLLVPFNTTYNLMISTTYFRLATTAAGAAISAGTYTVPVTIPSGTPAQVIGFQVVGAAN